MQGLLGLIAGLLVWSFVEILCTMALLAIFPATGVMAGVLDWRTLPGLLLGLVAACYIFDLCANTKRLQK